MEDITTIQPMVSSPTTVCHTDDSIKDGQVDYVTVGTKKIPKLNWVRIRDKKCNTDNRRLVDHRERNCQCEICYREVNKLPPEDPIRLKLAVRKTKMEEREIRRVKKKAKKDVKEGRQACIRNFFRY